MEQNFQTSFIPKKPMVEVRATATKPVGILVVLSMLVLFTILLGTAGLYFYKTSLTKSLAQMEGDLSKARNRFEPSKITELQLLDKRLRASSEILASHVIVTPIFEILQDLTMKTVRYTKFNYSIESVSQNQNGVDIKNDRMLVKISGLAIGYRSVALQSDLFTKNKNLIEPVFSNLTLNEKGEVVFDLEFSVDPGFVNYKQMVEASS